MKLEDDRLFDPLYGNPLFPIRGCDHMKQCSYPYCQCDVKYDDDGTPKKCREVPRFVWYKLGWWAVMLGALMCFWLGAYWLFTTIVV